MSRAIANAGFNRLLLDLEEKHQDAVQVGWLAEDCGVSYRAFLKWRKGDMRSFKIEHRLSKIFGVSVEELLQKCFGGKRPCQKTTCRSSSRGGGRRVRG